MERNAGYDQYSGMVNDSEFERRAAIVGLTAADVQRIISVKDVLSSRADEIAEAFFSAIKALPEGEVLFRRSDILAEAKRLKKEHLIALVGGKYGRAYVEQRVRLGALYAKVGLDMRVFLGAFHQMMLMLGQTIMTHSGKNPAEAFEIFMSVQKVGFMDVGLIIDVIATERERVIGAQQDAIRELSTPVLQVRDRLLILPIIGVLDSARAQQLTDSLLHSIRAARAKVVVMDITGVASVDSKVANHLIQTVSASRLMGATVIVTGLSAEVAQSLVALGVDLRALNTVGDLQGGLELAEESLGYRVVRTDGPGASV